MSHLSASLRILALAALATLSACAINDQSTPGNSSGQFTIEQFMPTHIGDADALSTVSIDELRRLNLVATNLVSVLLQIPELEALTSTFQVARPASAFGNVLLRVMEDAGFALQLVSSDQGVNYISYGQRYSTTDSGPVNDFHVRIRDIQITREFIYQDDGIYPASLVSIQGTRQIDSITVNDALFTEQGGNNSFISGARTSDASISDIREVVVNEYDRLPPEKQTRHTDVIAEAKQQYFETDARRFSPDLSGYERYRRSVLVFDNTDTLYLGDANKRSSRLLAQGFADNDLIVITGCNDVDGVNEQAQARAIRVEEELVGLGVPVNAIYLAPCLQTNYRHPTDKSPVPVEIVHYRPGRE